MRNRVLGAIAGLALLIVWLASVNLFPSINNDGVEYVAYSRDLVGGGLVELGFRQFGYPLFIWITGLLGGIAGVEDLLMIAFVQRMLLAGAVGYAIWLWRWKALPLVILVIAPSLVAFSDLVMTEGLTMPVAVLLGCLVSHYFTTGSNRTRVITAAGATAACLALASVRLTFVVFGVVPLAMGVAALRRRSRHTTPVMWLVATYVLTMGLLTVGLALENGTEYETTFPIVRTERAAYWAAWQVTFTLHEENRDDPDLAEYYDDGSPYLRIWEIEADHESYPDQALALADARAQMIAAASEDMSSEQIAAFWGAIRGGRVDELRPRIDQILATDAGSVDDAIHVNDVSQTDGREAFNIAYNRGQKPQSVVTSPIVPRLPYIYVHDVIKVLVPLAVLALTGLAIWKRRFDLGLVYLIPFLAFAALAGWNLADTMRFMITPSAYLITGFCALWAERPGQVSNAWSLRA